MTTYPTQDLFTEILEGKPIPIEKLEYFRTRLRLHIYDLVKSRFDQQETLNQAEYARRIRRKPEVINRLLGGPGNWTLDTISDLLIGLKLLPLVEDERVEDRLIPNRERHTTYWASTPLEQGEALSKQPRLGIPFATTTESGTAGKTGLIPA